jgi:hypothetical protein
MTFRDALSEVRRVHEFGFPGLVILPTVVVASLLVLYFDWRGRFRRRILGEWHARLPMAERGLE